MGRTMKTVTSPAQFFLFGEHGVVYDYPALVASTNLLVKSDFEKLENNKFKVVSENLGEVKGKVSRNNGGWDISPKEGNINNLKYVTRAAKKTFNHIGEGGGLDISISSDIPPSSGLGSSSAVTTATIAGVSSILGKELEREEIRNLAYQTEKEVQGYASKAGVSAATFGGCLSIEKDVVNCLEDFPNPKIVIGYTGNKSQTGEIVEKVRKKKENKPDIYGPIFEAIGENAKNGKKALQEGNMDKVGLLMNVNQGLLEGLGISTDKLSKLITEARKSGAIGSKMTGSGGGGCMIALTNNNEKEIKKSINNKAYSSFITEMGGARLNID